MKLGIWIDKHKADIISLKDVEISTTIIESEIEDFHVAGGSGTRFKGGPQDVVHDSKYLLREKQQLKRYFNQIIPHLKLADNIVIFGPAGTGEKFKKELSEKHRDISKKTRGFVKADSMTQNQKKEWVRNYFTH